MIVVASEIKNGVENPWKHGPLGGHHDYPDFGKCMPINHFKVFQAMACCCEKKDWYVDEKCGRSWDIFWPCLRQMNSCQAKLPKTMLLMLDESAMPGLRPTTSKLVWVFQTTATNQGSHYHYRNDVLQWVECISRILVFQDVV